MAPECNALLTKEMIANGECGCGGLRFRPINPDKNPFTDEEKAIIASGEVAHIDTSVKGEHPDVLNVDNTGHWDQVEKAVGKAIRDKRYKAARQIVDGETDCL